MGANSGKHQSEKEINKRRSHFRRLFQSNHTPRPVSYAGIDQHYEENSISTRPMSMIDVGPVDNLDVVESSDTQEIIIPKDLDEFEETNLNK